MNPSLLIKVWKRHVTDKYELQIEAGNLDYFLNKDYKEDLMNVEKSQTAEEIIDDIRTRMKEMTEENRSRSVKYIQNLTALSKHYV
jgi:ribosome recycling factor